MLEAQNSRMLAGEILRGIVKRGAKAENLNKDTDLERVTYADEVERNGLWGKTHVVQESRFERRALRNQMTQWKSLR